MLLNRASLALAHLASRDDTRRNLGGLYLTDREAVATNGHYLGIVTHVDEDPRDFPRVAGVDVPGPCGFCMPCWACEGARLVRLDERRAELERQLAEIGENDALPAPARKAREDCVQCLADLLAARARVADQPAWHECRAHRGALVDAGFTCPLAPPPFRPCLIPRDAALALEKALPKKTRLPILGHALVDVARCQDGVFRAVTTDLETTQPFEVRKLPEDFPDYRQILPRYRPLVEVLAALDARTRKTSLTVERLVTERACVEIGVSSTYLAELLATVRRMDADRSCAIRLRVPLDGASPLEMRTTLGETRQGVTLLLMPLRV